MREAIHREEVGALLWEENAAVGSQIGESSNMNRVREIISDGAFLVKRSVTVTIHEIEIAQTMLQTRRRNRASHSFVSDNALSLVDSRPFDSFHSIISLLVEPFTMRGIPLIDARHSSLHVCASAFASGCQPPVLSDMHCGESIFPPKRIMRRSQRVVAK